MKLRPIDVIILLVLGLLCVARATWGIFKDVNANLSTAQSVTGQVIYAGIIKMEENTINVKKYKTVLALTLDNSNQKFAIDRGSYVCNYLKTKIKSGDTLKLYYRDPMNEYNTFVFQIEKGQKILADFSDYKKGESKMIVLLYAFGFVILGGLLAWYLNKRKKEPIETAVV
jgi:hypothetical protein